MGDQDYGIWDGPRLPSRKRQRHDGPGMDVRWWLSREDEESPDDRHLRLVSFVRRLAQNQTYRRAANLHWARMYSDVEFPSLHRPTSTPTTFVPSRLTFNATKNAIDTLVAKIAKNKPLPMFLTNSAKRRDKSKAKAMTWVVDAVFAKMEFFRVATSVVLDTSVFGTGMMKIWRDGEDINCERVYPWEVLVDEADGQDGKPRCLYHVRWIDRTVLCELYPEHREAIMQAGQDSIVESAASSADLTHDRIPVIEAWHLRSGPSAKDGRHAICIDGCTLLDEQYDRDEFPIIVLRRQMPLIGFWGIGVTQEVAGIQYELNLLSAKIQRAHHLLGGTMWLVPESAGIPTGHIDNGIGTVVRYRGAARPEAVSPMPVHPQTYAHMTGLIPKVYEISGISQLSATSNKPAGLDSGAALREFNDIETERFLVFGAAYENFALDAAKHVIYHCREIANDNSDWEIQVKRRTHLDAVKFSEIDLGKDAYFIQPMPTSHFARTPAARMQQIQELAQAGWITTEQAKILLDFPDLESVLSPETASYRATEKIIERILDEGEYTPPVPQMNLQQARITAQLAWVEAWMDDEDPKRLALLQQWINAVDQLIEAAKAEGGLGAGDPMQGMMPGGAGPEGMAMGPEGGPPMGPGGPGQPPMPMAPEGGDMGAEPIGEVAA